MILEFRNSLNQVVLFGVSKDRRLSVASSFTGFVFTLVDDLSKFRKFSKMEEVALSETKSLVKGLKSEELVKDYVIKELRKVGFVFVGSLSPEDYLKSFKEIVKGVG